jgi:hypothetical protein
VFATERVFLNAKRDVNETIFNRQAYSPSVLQDSPKGGLGKVIATVSLYPEEYSTTVYQLQEVNKINLLKVFGKRHLSFITQQYL